jgi:hypothetical protein
LVARTPEQAGQPGSRWKLETVQQACQWLAQLTLSGVWRVLHRLDVRLKRARDYLHSPDPNYLEKLADIVAALAQAATSQGRIVLLFGDELTFYRQPSLARDWGAAGAQRQPLARRSYCSDTTARAISVLNGLTGQTTSLVASRIGVKQLISFYQQIRAVYAEAESIYLVQDNWPVHYHPDVLAALVPQQTRWEFKTPPSWSREPSAKAQRLCLPIQILPLPTYASWCNPIEKLWRWLQQEVIHLHRLADEWPRLKQGAKEFLDRFGNGSQALLRYVGLTPNSKLYGAVLAARAAPT